MVGIQARWATHPNQNLMLHTFIQNLRQETALAPNPAGQSPLCKRMKMMVGNLKFMICKVSEDIDFLIPSSAVFVVALCWSFFEKCQVFFCGQDLLGHSIDVVRVLRNLWKHGRFRPLTQLKLIRGPFLGYSSTIFFHENDFEIRCTLDGCCSTNEM